VGWGIPKISVTMIMDLRQAEPSSWLSAGGLPVWGQEDEPAVGHRSGCRGVEVDPSRLVQGCRAALPPQLPAGFRAESWRSRGLQSLVVGI